MMMLPHPTQKTNFITYLVVVHLCTLKLYQVIMLVKLTQQSKFHMKFEGVFKIHTQTKF
jgi:hypothetical protein